MPTDVTVREQVKTLVTRAEEELGPVEILVNCAGGYVLHSGVIPEVHNTMG